MKIYKRLNIKQLRECNKLNKDFKLQFLILTIEDYITTTISTYLDWLENVLLRCPRR